MKTFLIVLAAVALFFLAFPSQSNPIALFFFNELKFTGSSWVFEIYSSDPVYPDVLYLRSNAGTVPFRASFYIPSGYTLVTQDSLQAPLEINPQGDSLSVGSVGLGRLTFGNSPSAMVAAPLPGQSICFGGWGYYYLDNSPTLGQHNDSANAMGMIHGLVTDSLGQPQSDVRVSCIVWPSPVYTNASGQFDVRDYAHKCQMTLTHQGFYNKACTVQVWPENTVSVTIVMDRSTSVGESADHPAGFALHQNYPNPFNPLTTFSFAIPRTMLVTLRVYDTKGNEVATLVNEARAAGTGEAAWDASGVASGVYFYRLTAGSFVQTRKMVLIR